MNKDSSFDHLDPDKTNSSYLDHIAYENRHIAFQAAPIIDLDIAKHHKGVSALSLNFPSNSLTAGMSAFTS